MIEEEAISIPERSEIPALDEPQSEEAEIPEPKIAPDEDISQDQLIEDSEKMMVAEDMEVDDDMMFPEQAVVSEEVAVSEEVVVSEEIAVALDDVEEVQEIVSQEAAPVQGAATRARTKRSELRKNVEYQPEAEAPKQEKAMAPAAVDYTRMISGQLSGVVLSSEDMQPLPGAIVSLKGSSTGVYTDQDGRFSLPANEDSNTLIASFVGMETGEFPVNKLQDVELVMQPNLLTLDEVVVVGKGVTRPSEPEGSTQIVALEEQNESVDYSLAEPAGGYKAFKEYIAEQMRFPSEDPGISKAIVVLRFTVTRTGQIKDLFALKSPGDEFTGEALRLLKEGPEWIPASRDQKKIDDAVRLRIVFRK
jgi:hypothetical protein